MKRGIRLHNKLFDDKNTAPAKITKGRSSVLNRNRNACIVYRYYFYSKFFSGKLNYSFIIERLSNEFFLSPVTVPELLKSNSKTLTELKEQQPTIKMLSNKYPHLNWKVAV